VSPLNLAAGAAWKVATIVLAALLLVVGAGTGTGWWLAEHAHGKTRGELTEAQARIGEYQAAIREQNRATEVLAKEKERADARGEAARVQADGLGRRMDAALHQVAGARSTTCADAMPFVDRVLEQVR
jgi:hypothetical protein